MNINEVMCTDVKSCRPDSSLEEVARLMWDNDCGAIPVVNDQRHPIGIVTDRDIAMSATLNHRPLWELRASDVIQGQHLCCSRQEEPVESCLQKMEQNGVRRIPVVNEDGTLAGIVSMGDLVAFTGDGSARARQGTVGIPAAEVLGMLKHVSAHHAGQERPVAQLSV